MIEYRSFKYGQNKAGKWVFRFPSGLVASLVFDSEVEVKNHIDDVIAQFGS